MKISRKSWHYRLVNSHTSDFRYGKTIQLCPYMRALMLAIAAFTAGGENHLRPVSAGSRWTMFGGNFAWSSDSRWRKIAPAPLRIHDRIEG